MTTPAAPNRARRPFWFDPRFAIGLLLVVGSVVGVYTIIAAADRSTDVYTARGPLAAGDRVDAADFVVTPVRLGTADRLYLRRGELGEHTVILSRSLAAGELVPTSAISDESNGSQTSVVLRVQGELAASVGPGSSVDVWSAAVKEHATYAAPTVLVGGATVVRLIQSDGLVAGRDGRSIEVRVPGGSVAAVLQAIANNDAISLVPAPASSGVDR
ncbi:hypothetical protein [Rathayibacter soli]|uniref:hypothetical protein n=1 Tax=Rathayibacter soli TaxID=3144168 RepID=UPI0027E47519|nr:hypothetical protein [Glaciibacter superstes]